MRSASSGSKLHKVVLWTEVIGIPVGIVALLLTAYQTYLATEALADQRIANAWQILAIEGSGNNGKAYALNTLAQRGERIVGLDLSCKLAEKEECEVNRPWIYGVDFTGAEGVFRIKLDYTVLERVRFGAGLSDSSVSNSILNDVSFVGGPGGYSRLRIRNSIVVDATFSDAVVTDIDFTGSDIQGLKFGRNIQLFPSSINVSGVSFCRKVPITDFLSEEHCNNKLGRDFFKQAFFLKNNPPKDLGKMPGDYLIRSPCEPGKTTKECDAQPLVPISSIL